LTIQQASTLNVVAFSTESNYDSVVVNGLEYSGTHAGPAGVSVGQGSVITFTSDGTITYSGFKICFSISAPLLDDDDDDDDDDSASAVATGPCTVDSSGCWLSPNYPSNYGNEESCTVRSVKSYLPFLYRKY